jgi:hypothetical protein
MADDFEVKITGLSELQAKLEELATTDARAIVKDCLNAGAIELKTAMVEGSHSVPGEPGAMLRDTSNWSKRVKMEKEDLAGTVRVGVKGSLPDTHTSKGHGTIPKGNRYRRSLAYILRLLEFGGRDPAYNLGHSHPMTSGFESHQSELLAAIVARIKTRLKL